jgi:hypothetical protein
MLRTGAPRHKGGSHGRSATRVTILNSQGPPL